jgi:hypothetical protein
MFFGLEAAMVQPVRSTDPADLQALWPRSQSNCAIGHKLSGKQGEFRGLGQRMHRDMPKNAILRHCPSNSNTAEEHRAAERQDLAVW